MSMSCILHIHGLSSTLLISRYKALARGERHRVSCQVFGDRHHRTHLCGPFDIAMKIPLRFQKKERQIVQIECNRSVTGIVLPSWNWNLAALEWWAERISWLLSSRQVLHVLCSFYSLHVRLFSVVHTPRKKQLAQWWKRVLYIVCIASITSFKKSRQGPV